MIRVVPRALLLVSVLVVVLAISGPALAAFPGADGRVAFSRSAGKNYDYDIFTMRANGKDKRVVVGSPLPEYEPAFSADGTRLLFTRDVDPRLAHANNEIFVKDLIGNTITRLTNHPANDWNPAFSPGGSFVAFSSDRGGDYDIVLLNLGSSSLTPLARAGDDFSPAFSPDGVAIVWSGYMPNGRADLFFETLGGGGPQNMTMTPRKSEEEPNVSPAATHVVFQRWGRRGDVDPEIVLRRISSGATTVLTRNRASDLRPVFSPSGNRIAWERSWDGTDTSSQIWTMRIDGTGQRARTPRRYDADSPDWQPLP